MTTKKLGDIEKAILKLKAVWQEAMNLELPVMSPEEFEKQLKRVARRRGVAYGEEPGKWLALAKAALADPNTSRELRNKIMWELGLPAFRKADAKFGRAFAKLIGAAEFSYRQLLEFCNDETVDKDFRDVVKWRLYLPALAYHEMYKHGERWQKAGLDRYKIWPVVKFDTSKATPEKN